MRFFTLSKRAEVPTPKVAQKVAQTAARRVATEGIAPRISGFHGFRIHHPCRPRNGIGTEANEGNEEEFLLRFLRSLLFRRNPCHPCHPW